MTIETKPADKETERTIPANEMLDVIREALTKTIEEKYGSITVKSMRHLWHATLILALDAGVNALAPGESKPTAEESFAIYDESLDVIERSMHADHVMAVKPHTDRHVFRRRLGMLTGRFLAASRDDDDQHQRRMQAADGLLSMVAAIMGAVLKGKAGQKLSGSDVALVKKEMYRAIRDLEYTGERHRQAADALKEWSMKKRTKTTKAKAAVIGPETLPKFYAHMEECDECEINDDGSGVSSCATGARLLREEWLGKSDE
jgi:hypothetical protein